MVNAQDVKSRLTCRQFLERYGFNVNRGGFCICPFHNDSKPSMKVYSDPNRGVNCFVCHTGGDLITIAKRFYGCDFKTALKTLSDEFNLGLDNQSSISTEERRRAENERKTASLKRLVEEQVRSIRQDNYWTAFDEWLKCDRALQHAPVSPYDDWPDDFCDALMHREEIQYKLDIAIERRCKAWEMRKKP